MQALIETYLRTPEKERSPEQYDRIAALKAPFDSRFAALKARKDALKTRFDAIEAEMTEQEQALAGMKKLDLELLAQRQLKTAALRDASGSCGPPTTTPRELKAPSLAPLLNSADEILKTLSDRGFDGAKNRANPEAPRR